MQRSNHRHRAWRQVAALLLVTGLVAAACGDDDDGPEATTDGTAAEEPTSADETPEQQPAATDEATTEEASPPEAAGPPPEAPGFDGETIKLGYLTDQTGPLAIVGGPLLAGSQAYWNWVNEELGGVGGRYKVELVAGDTKDDEATTVQEFQRIKDDVVMIAEILSTPPTQALVEFLNEEQMIGVPGSLAAQWNKEANLLPNGTAYEFEMINLADWYVNQSDIGSAEDVACAVHVSDKYGEDTLRGVEHAAEQLGFELASVQTIARGDTDFTAQITALSDASCEVVYSITVPREQNGLLATANAQGFAPVWLGALPSYINLLASGDNAKLYEDFYIALDTPGLERTDVPGMADFLDRFATYGGGGDPSTFHLSGYFQSISVHALLEAAVARGDLSREGLLAAYAELGEVDTNGLADNYIYGLPEDRVPASASRIFKFDATVPPNLLTEVGQVESELIAGFEY